MSYSIFSFQLNGTQPKDWPSYSSIERFYGRKCMEFEWQSGDDSLLIGIQNPLNDFIFFFGNFSETRYETRRNNTVLNFTMVGHSFNMNERYMFCFDTVLNRALLINNTYTFTYNFTSQTNGWKLAIQQGAEKHPTGGTAWFNYPFKNIIPSGFFSLADPRSLEVVSCRQTQYFRISKLSYIFIFLSS